VKLVIAVLVAKRFAGTVVSAVQLEKQLLKFVTVALLAKRFAGTVVKDVQPSKQLAKLESPGIFGITEVD
jgi:hypothetical protein